MIDDTFPETFESAGAAARTATEHTRALNAEMTRLKEMGEALSKTLTAGFDRAFTAALKDGAKLSDVLRTLALDLSRTLASNAIDGLTGQISGALGNAVGGGLTNILGQGIGGLFGFANGAAFDAGRVRAFANGGIVGGPTLFPMHGGTGLMGEAGPEAILPLRRGADGRLGVASGGQGGASPVTVNIHTRDADSFARSRTQVAATLARAVDRGRRNM